MHPLDNVIWEALTTRQTEFAESCGLARRFMPEVTSLAGLREPSEHGYESLAELLVPGGTVALFLEVPFQHRPGWEVIASVPLLQMVCENGESNTLHADPHPAISTHERKQEIVELGDADCSEMLELTALTKPGPFNQRTHQLGTYLGIRCQGKLVAMAGERLKVPGHTEVSAVCTHPKHTGKGYARTLMMEVMRDIRSRGETPFLHVREDNARAIALYEQIGFRRRLLSHLAILRKPKS